MEYSIHTTLENWTDEEVALHARAMERVRGMDCQFAWNIRNDVRMAIHSQRIFEELEEAARKRSVEEEMTQRIANQAYLQFMAPRFW